LPWNARWQGRLVAKHLIGADSGFLARRARVVIRGLRIAPRQMLEDERRWRRPAAEETGDPSTPR
jgi:hypothetical protein